MRWQPGIDGASKSTQMQRVREALSPRLLEVAELGEAGRESD